MRVGVQGAVAPSTGQAPRARRAQDDKHVLCRSASCDGKVWFMLWTHADKVPDARPEAVVWELAPPTGVGDSAVVKGDLGLELG